MSEETPNVTTDVTTNVTTDVTTDGAPSNEPQSAVKLVKDPKTRKARKSAGSPVLTASATTTAQEDVPASVEPRRPSRLRPIVFPALAVVTLAALIAAAVLQFSGGPKKQLAPLNAGSKAAMAEAAHAVKDILSYDYRQLDSNISTAKSDITGQLLSDYTSTAQKLLIQAVPIKAIVTATVSAQSIVQAQSGRVVVLLYVDQESVKQLAGSKSPTTRIDPLRVQMTMTKVKGRWMASDLEPV
jgi:Mce-associated membrane protein